MRALFLTPLLIFIVLLLVMLAKLINTGNNTNDPLIGQKIAPFTLPVAYSGLAGLNSQQLDGKYSLLNVFGSWCITCKIEHPFLMQLMKSNKIAIYGIAWRDQPEKLAKYLKENGNPYVAIGNDTTGKEIIALGVSGAPETLLIAPDGIIKARYVGALSEDVWRSKFLPNIKEKD